MPRATAGYLKALCVGGRIIVDDGVLLSVDLAALERELMDQACQGEAVLSQDKDAIHMHRNKVRDFFRDGGAKPPR